MAAEDPAGEDERTVASPARSRSGEPKLPQGGLAAGEHVGRYVIREAMAEGGMGVVYLARDPELDRDVAIKLIRPGADADPLEAGARLLREAQAMARLSHPNVVVIHDVGTAAGGGVFLAMEYVKGTTLRAWLADRERSWREIIDAFVAAGRGLAAAHAAGVIHRDFKPDNVLVRSDDGRVQVTDFGLARDAAVEEQLPSEPVRQISQGILALSVTVTGDVLGTPRYMAPEQHQRTATDAATDQFSYAVALYSALCGRHPFGDVKDAGFVARVLEGKPAPPSTHLPARVRSALVRALDRSPDRRFPTLDALLAELTPRPSRTWLWVLAAIAVGLAIVLATRRGSAPHTGLKVARSVPLTRVTA